MSIKNTTIPTPDSEEIAISVQNLVYAYPSSRGTPVLNLPSWQVSVGQHVFLSGDSGSGKSTLLNLLAGILRPTKGEMTILGQSMSSMAQGKRDRFRANNIGYIFQQFNLIPYLTAIENIQLAARFGTGNNLNQNLATGDKIAAILARLNISEEESKKETRQLSIGQQQRIAIARALVQQPKLLIADEPTSSLDTKNRSGFMTLLMDVLSGMNTTLVFVSHDRSLADFFTRHDSMSKINHGQEVSNVH